MFDFVRLKQEKERTCSWKIGAIVLNVSVKYSQLKDLFLADNEDLVTLPFQIRMSPLKSLPKQPAACNKY